MNKYLVIYTVAITITAIVLAFVVFGRKPTVPYDEVLIDKEKEKLRSENESLLKEIYLIKDAREVYLAQIDSLQNLKQPIRIIYAEKFKEIDNSSVSASVDNLKHIFTDNGIK